MPPGEHLYPTGEHVVTNSTALHSAAMHGNTDILDYILQNVDPGMITAIDPNNAGVFHYTAYSLRGKDTSLVSGLIRTLATAWGRVNPEGWFTRDCLGNTPLLAAIKEHNFAVARELLKYPAVSAEELPEALIKALHVQDPDHREESLEKRNTSSFSRPLSTRSWNSMGHWMRLNIPAVYPHSTSLVQERVSTPPRCYSRQVQMWRR